MGRFQSTHPGGVRPIFGVNRPSEWQFQSTHPGGVRQALKLLCSQPHGFQSTHPGGVRPLWRMYALASVPYFNPRTRVGCDGFITPEGDNHDISIHAPGWGATFGRHMGSDGFAFQSTHPGGVRQGGIQNADQTKRFQSTHPGGVRRSSTIRHSRHRPISIHAPGWGATICYVPAISLRKDFNPRTRVGCDPSLAVQP